MPSNTLALGLYERCILKRTFRHTTGFFRFREGERRRLSRADNFLQQLRRSGVSRVRGEKVAAARTEKLCTHSLTHTHTHSHTGRLLYPRYSPAAARVIKPKLHWLTEQTRLGVKHYNIEQSCTIILSNHDLQT